jgi:hypothetical protein
MSAVHPASAAGTRPRSRAWSAAAPVGLALGALGAGALLGRVDPHVPGFYPVCPSYALTGLYCPGCGTLRALHDLWHLDLAGAWSMNPLAVLALPVVIASWLAWVRRAVTGSPRRWISPPWVPVAVLVVVLAFWVLRNVPTLEPYLAP